VLRIDLRQGLLPRGSRHPSVWQAAARFAWVSGVPSDASQLSMASAGGDTLHPAAAARAALRRRGSAFDPRPGRAGEKWMSVSSLALMMRVPVARSCWVPQIDTVNPLRYTGPRFGEAVQEPILEGPAEIADAEQMQRRLKITDWPAQAPRF